MPPFSPKLVQKRLTRPNMWAMHKYLNVVKEPSTIAI